MTGIVFDRQGHRKETGQYRAAILQGQVGGVAAQVLFGGLGWG